MSQMTDFFCFFLFLLLFFSPIPSRSFIQNKVPKRVNLLKVSPPITVLSTLDLEIEFKLLSNTTVSGLAFGLSVSSS